MTVQNFETIPSSSFFGECSSSSSAGERSSSLSFFGKRLFTQSFSGRTPDGVCRRMTITESGRSMVEMLGVLAIIGVLSVGGIMGYSYSMDKWRANETIDDVNLRMVDVMTRVSQGREVLEISPEFEDTGRAGYVIDVFQNTDSEPSIMVEKVPSGVCKMILQNTPDTQDIYVGVLSADEKQVDGNWYLGDNEDICDDGDKEMLFALDESILTALGEDGEYATYLLEATATVIVTPKPECYSNADCRPDKPYCDNTGTCVVCTKNEHCVKKYGETLPFCNTTSCEKCPDKIPLYDAVTQSCVECLEDSDCKEEGYYCFGDSYSPDIPHNTLCKKINTTPNYQSTDLTYVSIGMTLDWWNAKKACELIGMRMPYVTDFYPDWNGESGFTSLTPKEEYEQLLNIGGIGSWATDSRGNSYMVSFFGKHIGKFPKNVLDSTHRITCKPID